MLAMIDDYGDLFKILKRCGYWFFPHIPTFINGVTVDVRTFDTKEELVEYVKRLFDRHNKENGKILCMSKDGYIIEVKDSGNYWWVIGYTNLEVGTFPDWKEFANSKK